MKDDPLASHALPAAARSGASPRPSPYPSPRRSPEPAGLVPPGLVQDPNAAPPPESEGTTSTARAILLMVLSSFFFTCMTLCVKGAGSAETLAARGAPVFGPLEAVFVRSLPMALLCCYLVRRDLRRGAFDPSTLPPRTRRWLLSRGLVGATSMACLFYASLHVPLATASLLSNTSVFFTGVLAHVFLGERLSARRLALVLAGFLCVGLVLYDGIAATFSPAVPAGGLVVALLSGFLSSVAYFSVRKLKAVPGNVIILALAVAGLLIPWTGLLTPGGLNWPRTERGWVLLCLSSAPAIAGQLCMTAALRAGPAGVVSSGQYMGPVFATLFGILFFAEHPSPLKLLGGFGVICFGVAIPLVRSLPRGGALARALRSRLPRRRHGA